uniref:Uncharacterized protein n=1 Tax=Pseudo-nitzschia australis TaxID=44445 RepID=A0A7S4AA89_9STRA|mmetsp:Transcript_24106/g.50866  ORF Transcript_24106/g.50866 Transcript_24106/m.50866 type:complete len:476 (-) Transcript_24106:539-1966(-)
MDYMHQHKQQESRTNTIIGETEPVAKSPSPADPSNATSFLASLDPELRKKTLLSADKAFLQSLPATIIAEARALRGQKKSVIIERKSEFPAKLRSVIDELTEAHPDWFLWKMESELKNLFRGAYHRVEEARGLNCDRDTEAQVEIAIRFFPRILSEIYFGRKIICVQLSNRRWRRGRFNFKTASFVPLFAKLGVELGQFREEERGGLNVRNDNMLKIISGNHFEAFGSKEHYRLVDETCVAIMKRLRELELFKKEDIIAYNLIGSLLQGPVFPEQRFRFLVEWNPNCLAAFIDIRLFMRTLLPIKYAAISDDMGVVGFQKVFEIGMEHFPKKFGFLFHKGLNEKSPFRNGTAYQVACQKHGKENVEKIIDDAWNTARARNDRKQIGLDALLYASAESTVHLDLVYFLLRRDPSLLHSAASHDIPLIDNDIKNPQKRKLITRHHGDSAAAGTGAARQRRKQCGEHCCRQSSELEGA